MQTSLHVLIVDDVQDSANSFALLIGLWGHKVIVAYNGSDALHAASANPPDVVLLDIGLPDMDGCEVARRLRQLPKMDQALLIAISGFGREADVKCCKEAGIDGHFIKPMDLSHLRTVLTKAEALGPDQRRSACEQ